MKDTDLGTIRARAAAATPGPWTPDPGTKLNDGTELFANNEGDIQLGVAFVHFGADDQAERDREFFIHSRSDVATLLAEVDRLTRERHDLDAQLNAGATYDAAQRDEVDRLRANATYWETRFRAESRTRWDDTIPPGGEVCADCGEPVESEPCALHNPTTALGTLAEDHRMLVGALTVMLDNPSAFTTRFVRTLPAVAQILATQTADARRALAPDPVPEVPTVADIRRHPHYWISGPGRPVAEATDCPHGYHLTDSCPGCDAED